MKKKPISGAIVVGCLLVGSLAASAAPKTPWGSGKAAVQKMYGDGDWGLRRAAVWQRKQGGATQYVFRIFDRKTGKDTQWGIEVNSAKTGPTSHRMVAVLDTTPGRYAFPIRFDTLKTAPGGGGADVPTLFVVPRGASVRTQYGGRVRRWQNQKRGEDKRVVWFEPSARASGPYRAAVIVEYRGETSVLEGMFRSGSSH